MSFLPFVSEALNDYFAERQHQVGEKAFQNEKNELLTAFYLLIEEWGFERSKPGGKMTNTDVMAAQDFFQRVNTQRLLHAPADLERVFERYKKSRASRRTYGKRLEKFLDWCQTQSWWPGRRAQLLERECCPPRLISGIRHVKDFALTHRQGKYIQYALQARETPEALELQFFLFWEHLTVPHHPQRIRPPIAESTAKIYCSTIRLAFGYMYRERGVPREALSFSTLVPVINLDDLDDLKPSEQRKLWKDSINGVREWLYGWFDYSRQVNQAMSATGFLAKVNAIESLAFFLYRDQVTQAYEYSTIPLFQAIRSIVHDLSAQRTQERKAGKRVTDLAKKWPPIVEKETALATVIRTVAEPLRLFCRPRCHKGEYRDPDVVLAFLQKYIKWGLLLYLPPRRQQDHRNLRIAASCPCQRPDSVPPDGVYFPLPSQQQRDRRLDGRISDNYIARVYEFQQKSYPEGVWVLSLEAFKTDAKYGNFSCIIPNRQFEDGQCFYDYLEWYFCGRWILNRRRSSRPYQWWDTALIGRRGEWNSPGLLYFDSGEVQPQEVEWRWQLAFPLPHTGRVGSASSYAGSFKITSKQLIQIPLTPHMPRYFWASWGFQVGLNEQQMASLAYAMGHSVKTLRDMYEQCPQSEKLRPIEEAIDFYLFENWKTPDDVKVRLSEEAVAMQLLKMTPQERERVMQLVASHESDTQSSDEA